MLSLSEDKLKELVEQTFKKVLSEQEVSGTQQPVVTQPQSQPQETEFKPKLVKFDQSTNAPYEVIFTERGFVIDDTRMSFEELEKALSKGYNIVLNAGNGFVLTQERMQSIVKYKDMF